MDGSSNILKQHKRNIHLSCLDPSTDKHLGGVATIARNTQTIGIVRAKTPAFQEAAETGRAAITVNPVSAKMQLAVANIYGYTGGNHRKGQLRKTNSLLSAAIEELATLAGKHGKRNWLRMFPTHSSTTENNSPIFESHSCTRI